MDIASLGIVGVGAITVLCYVIGEAIKTSKLDNKWIPTICAVSGIVLGIVGLFFMTDFPATDYVTAAAVGAFSGLAATGINQVAKQLSTKEE